MENRPIADPLPPLVENSTNFFLFFFWNLALFNTIQHSLIARQPVIDWVVLMNTYQLRLHYQLFSKLEVQLVLCLRGNQPMNPEITDECNIHQAIMNLEYEDR